MDSITLITLTNPITLITLTKINFPKDLITHMNLKPTITQKIPITLITVITQ